MARIRKKALVGLTIMLAVIICAGLYARPVPLVKAEAGVALAQPNLLQPVNLPWPSSGQAAVGAVDYGVLAHHNDGTAVPMASIAKVMAVLAILDKKPLAAGQPGPSITITPDDVAEYHKDVANNESVLPVNNGEQLSEYKALQAMLIPSANNIAFTAARWAFGSLDSYVAYANQRAKDFGMINTTLADASGFSPDTKSTASDLILLGLAALKNPLVSAIINQPQVNLPIAGTVKNVNELLGEDGIFGIKTGNTDQAGGCFLLAAKRTINNYPITVLTAVMGTPNLSTALANARSLLLASDDGFVVSTTNFSRSYRAPWGATATVHQQVSILAWRSSSVSTVAVLNDLPAAAPAGTKAGTVTVKNAGYSKTLPLYLDQQIKKPSAWWRIFR